MGKLIVTALTAWQCLPLCGQVPTWQAGVAKVSVNPSLNREPGTAFIVAIEGRTAYLVTCFHVIEGDSNPKVEFVAAPGKILTAARKDYQKGSGDRGLALLVVDGVPDSVRAVPLGVSSNTGDAVIVAGFPAPDAVFTVVDAIISSKTGLDIKLSRETPEGFSGGPVIKGNAAVALVWGNERGFGQAMPADTVKLYVDALKTPVGGEAKPLETSAAKAPAPAVGSKKGETKVNTMDGLTYVWISPGKFMMGCSPGDNECGGDEKPAHEVTISKGFWMGQIEVTQETYQQVRGSNPSHFEGATLPVEQVSWDDAEAYCAAVGMRLPTEAEWEYAARGGSTSARYGELDSVAWYHANSGSKTNQVGQKQANGFGLYDMLGNVWEWTADWYGPYQSGEAVDPKGPSTGNLRARRGGSWNGNPSSVRVSNRVSPKNRKLSVGFRCVGELR